MPTKTPAKTLMIQGTTSDAGKSTLVAGLCRVWSQMGYRVAPFKPQNMALNSAVTEDGGEIGRAQAVQAKAARVPAEVDFNPILLKPSSDTGAQVIVHGKALTGGNGAMEAGQYHNYKKVAMNAVLESHQRLSERFELICVEGAGSPAEINLRAGDIANMGFAEEVNCPVVIIADIDKGGVFAHLVGTLALLSQSEQDRVVGFVINRFRGDIALLQSGLDWLEHKTTKPVLGVLPYLHQLEIAQEDAIATEQDNSQAKVRIAVLVTPRMSNHTDFDCLRLHPEIDCQFVYGQPNQESQIPSVDLIMLAGSKNVRDDLAFLKAQGWHRQIARHLRYGGKVFGICGGYQMLGQTIADPYGVEGQPGQSEGLAYLPITTTLAEQKTLKNVSGWLNLSGQQAQFNGYEIHAGISIVESSVVESKAAVSEYFEPIVVIGQQQAGLISQDNQIAGCYVHGLFDHIDTVSLLMNWLGSEINQKFDFDAHQERAIERVADACREHLALDKIEHLLTAWYKNNYADADRSS